MPVLPRFDIQGEVALVTGAARGLGRAIALALAAAGADVALGLRDTARDGGVAAEKVRAFFADALGLSSADAGGGWLIFALSPAELAVHPGDCSPRSACQTAENCRSTSPGTVRHRRAP